MWTYHQSSGKLYVDDKYIGLGYSGRGYFRNEGRNNPDMEGIKDAGPIPRGRYRIGFPYNHAKLGPVTMDLEPVDVCLVRTYFRIHGDNARGDASTGCIILDRVQRHLIANSIDRELLVVG